MSDELQRTIGMHDAQIYALNARVDQLDKDLREIREDMRRIFEKLESINQTLSEAKGGWKTLMWVAGASAACGGIVMKIVSILGK
jgi:chromosome segregation ATPase